MEHRHLLPDEIALLVDNEEGFGVAPLRAHLEQCARCRAEYDAQVEVLNALESLPHLSPSPLFAYKVIKSVRVFEPWHVAALDSVRRLIPVSRPGRLAVGATAAAVALSLTMVVTLLATRLETTGFVLTVVAARLKAFLVDGASALGQAAIGESAASLIRSNGSVTVAVLATLFVATLVGTALGLRAVASASRRRRS